MDKVGVITTNLDIALARIQDQFFNLSQLGRLQVSFEGAIGFNYYDTGNVTLDQIVMDVEVPTNQEAVEIAVEAFVARLGAKASILVAK